MTSWLGRDPGRCCGRLSWGCGGSKWSKLEPWKEGCCPLDPGPFRGSKASSVLHPHTRGDEAKRQGFFGPYREAGGLGDSLAPGP